MDPNNTEKKEIDQEDVSEEDDGSYESYESEESISIEDPSLACETNPQNVLTSTEKILDPQDFARLAREIIRQYGDDYLLNQSAVEALQEAAEAYLTFQFEFANMSAQRRGSNTVTVEDMRILNRVTPTPGFGSGSVGTGFGGNSNSGPGPNFGGPGSGSGNTGNFVVTSVNYSFK